MNNEDKQKFRKLFGIEPELLGETVIISPFLSPKIFKTELKKPQYFKGLVYKGINGVYKNKKITFIHTGIGEVLVGDCVLAQDAERVSAIIFLGAVGAVNGLKIGDNVIIEKAFHENSFFSDQGKEASFCLKDTFSAPSDIGLLELSQDLLKQKKLQMPKINVLSLRSLWQQDRDFGLFIKKKNIQSVDLECAYFYACAKQKKIKALAFCFVSDQIINRPYWSDFSLAEKMRIKNSIAVLVNLALELCVLS